MIVPCFPELNIYSYSRKASSVVSAGAVIIATMVNKIPGWRAEIIDENNYSGPRDEDGFPDHEALQRDNPADAVGFYCGLTSTIERVWQLAALYKRDGAKIVAGGWHASYCPEETLRHNIDVVVHGNGTLVIVDVINAFFDIALIKKIDGVSFLRNDTLVTNPPKTLCHDHLDALPIPDFGLLRFCKPKVYPISRIEGCGMKCEFCSVRHQAVWATARHLFETVVWLVETRGAKKFFIVDDRMEEDMAGTIEFFQMVAQKYGRRLQFYVQTRMRTAEDKRFMELLWSAGVRSVFIGSESPIDEDLAAMNKGYNSQKMIEWVKILRKYFWVHMMLIYGYPPKQKTNNLSAKEMFLRFWRFISKSKPDSIQVLKPIPLVGTELRARLESQGRVFPNNLVPWRKYDGNSLCFIPDNMSVDEMYKYSMLLMTRFYSPIRLIGVILRTIFFPIDYLVRGGTIGLKMGYLKKWKLWHSVWISIWRKGWQKDLISCAGFLILMAWKKRHKQDGIQDKLRNYCERESPLK
jgi:radical SAM superfamily enzyme YgiQ (UPF0313 family)